MEKTKYEKIIILVLQVVTIYIFSGGLHNFFAKADLPSSFPRVHPQINTHYNHEFFIYMILYLLINISMGKMYKCSRMVSLVYAMIALFSFATIIGFVCHKSPYYKSFMF